MKLITILDNFPTSSGFNSSSFFLVWAGITFKSKDFWGAEQWYYGIQVYLASFNSIKIAPWRCRGEGRLALSKPFSHIFFEVTSVGRNNEAKVANSTSRVKIVLKNWTNKCCQNFTASEGTVLEIHAVFTKPQCGIYVRDLFSMAELMLLLGS